MARFTQSSSSSGSSFSPLPNFLRYVEGRSQLPALNENFGWDNYGVWFGPTSNTAADDNSYPVFTNFTIGSETAVEVSVDVEADASCTDFGLALYLDGTVPYWSFGPNQSAITAQFNCPNVELNGTYSTAYGPGGSLPGPGTYRYVLAYNPTLESSQVTFSVYDSQNQVVAGLALDERLPGGTAYRIGFASDLDSGDDSAGRDRSYMSNLSIIVGPGEGQLVYSDSLTNGYSGSSTTVDLTVPVSILDSNSDALITFEKSYTGTARIVAPQDDLALRSSRDIILYPGDNGPGNVYINWGDAEMSGDSSNKVATIGDISGIKTFEKIYVNNNDGTGNNIAVGDDAWIGDVNVSNFMSVQGQQNVNLGGILFGSAKANSIYTDGSGLVLEANNGDMNFYMDGGMYIGNSDSTNQIMKRSDLDSYVSPAMVRYQPTFAATGLTFTGSGTTYPTYNSYYTKAGKMVSFVIEVDLSTVTNFGTGQYTLELPFDPAIGYNHFSGWAQVDTNVNPDVPNGHVVLNVDHAGITSTLDLHYLKQAGGAHTPIIEGLFLQGTPVTLTTTSKIYVNGTYIAS